MSSLKNQISRSVMNNLIYGKNRDGVKGVSLMREWGALHLKTFCRKEGFSFYVNSKNIEGRVCIVYNFEKDACTVKIFNKYLHLFRSFENVNSDCLVEVLDGNLNR